MKAAILAGVLFFAALFALTTFLPAPAARAEAERYFPPAVIERGLERSLQGKLLFWASTAVHLGVLALIVFTGFARRLTDACRRWTGARWLATVQVIGAVLFLGDAILSLPFGLAALEWQRSWGLSHQTPEAWLGDYLKGLAVSAVPSFVLLVGLYLLLRYFPRTWWALAAVGATLLGIGYAIIMPIWINPLFNTFTPLSQTPWASLERPVQALAARVGVPVEEILVMDASRRGSHTNAYFTGFGATRRVVLYDTLLKSHMALSPAAVARAIALASSPLGTGPVLAAGQPLAQSTLGEEELLSILAHEFGHWQHDHIVKGIALGGVGLFAGLFLLAQILKWAVGRPPFLLARPDDPAGLPLIVLAVMLGSWATRPVENAISRVFERQADMASLQLYGHPDVFIAAEERLARDNISNVAPNPLSVWLFATHPPAVERIHMAEEWRAMHP